MKSKSVNKQVIKFLSDPDTYGIKGEVKVIQTHSSYVFIAGRYVYKIKKPVDFGFLDYSTLDKRKLNSDREVRLNSRFSDAYIGVIAVRKLNGNLTLGDDGEPLEYAVKMKRIPERYFMKDRLSRGLVSRRDIRKISVKLSEFYKSQALQNSNSDYVGGFDIASILLQNHTLASKFIGKTISQISFETINLFNSRFMKKNKRVLGMRGVNGYVKDCHGDLHLEHIIIKPDEIELFDCIEFNESFRVIDYVCDIAFLAMDLEYNGSFDLARYFAETVISKMDDEEGLRLLDFYKSYRAYVRGKVESLRFADIDMPEENKFDAYKRAVRYFQLSLRYCLFGSAPVVIVVFGIIGAGKSTFARALSGELGCEIVSTDLVRKHLVGIEPTEKANESAYSRYMTENTYNEMNRQAEERIKQNNIIVLDGSFSNKKYREKVLKKFSRLKCSIYFIEVRAKEKDIKKRLLEREHTQSVSDARINLLEKFKTNYDKPTRIPGAKLFRTDPTKDIFENIKKLFRDLVK